MSSYALERSDYVDTLSSRLGRPAQARYFGNYASASGGGYGHGCCGCSCGHYGGYSSTGAGLGGGLPLAILGLGILGLIALLALLGVIPGIGRSMEGRRRKRGVLNVFGEERPCWESFCDISLRCVSNLPCMFSLPSDSVQSVDGSLS